MEGGGGVGGRNVGRGGEEEEEEDQNIVLGDGEDLFWVTPVWISDFQVPIL